VEYNVKINEFEGPLDLLLHLIKEAKMSIWDISISEITDQYLNYIRAMEELELEIASEYLTMAAELIYIKSRLLLPNEKLETSDEYEEDPKEELIRRLLEYKKYKEATTKFRKLSENRQLYYTRPQGDLTPYMKDIPPLSSDISIYDLMSAFQKLMRRKALMRPLETTVTKIGITVEERMKEIKNRLIKDKKVNFSDLFEILTKDYIITTFLSILELAKNNVIELRQNKNFDDILINLKEGEVNG
jgi:segregation and condensation protein A